MKLRSRIEIACNVLEAAKEGANKTKIMYKAFLTYNQLKGYISELIEKNLLEYSDQTRTYKTTAIGLNLLKMDKEIREAIQPVIKNKQPEGIY